MYMAKCSGTIVLKDGVDANEVDKLLDNGLFNDTYPNGKNIDVYAQRDNYREERFFTLYDKIAPFVKEANIEFTGEDGSVWKHECKDGVWNELSGEIEIVYKNPTHIAGLKSKTEVYQSLKDVVDSMQIDSETQIASYTDKENDIYLSLEVRGAVKVEYKGEYYTQPSDFPDELKNLIKDGYIEYDENNVPTKLPFSYSPEVNVLDNNWFELFRLDKDGSPFGESWVVDCEEYTDADIDSLFEDTAAEILKYEREIAEKTEEER